MSTIFEVWAPEARAVAVEVDGVTTAMEAAQQASPPALGPSGGGRSGWWRAEVAEAGPGSRYGFRVEGGELLPDPRSAYQPLGPHGPSEVVDHSSFKWSDHHWQGVHLPSAVIYEAHIGTFSTAGTFAGAEAHLSHLSDLGVNVVELLPVAQGPGERGWGYDGVDLYAPQCSYGRPEEMKHFVDAAHSRGIGVFLDVVYNHLGPDGNYLGSFGPYFTDRYATPWGAALNLDGPRSDEVRAFLVGNALYWLDHYHLDGLRLDAIHAIVDTSATHFLEELASEVAALGARLGRKLWLVAESDLNDPRVVAPLEAGGRGMDAQWSDDFHHALWAASTGESTGYYADYHGLGDLAKATTSAFVLDGRYSNHRERRHGRAIGTTEGHRFLAYIQNHDQVGNRAAGERMSGLMGVASQKIALGLVLASPFVPMLFQGDEWGATTPFCYFTDHTDPGLAAAVSHGRRQEFAAFGWDPQDVPDPQSLGTFEASKLDWAEVGREPHSGILAWVGHLIRLRREHTWLCDGRLDRIEAKVEGSALVIRRGPGVIVANFGPTDISAEVDISAVVLASSDGQTLIKGRSVTVGGEAFAIVGPAPAEALGSNDR